tara:strand:+ start:1284 stop:3557 length:2274 start_codon:yes stop_codon:yes gene_type:complete
MSFSYFASPEAYIKSEIDLRKGNILYGSKLNAWIRVTSGVGNGMVITSNPNLPLFYAANAIYGGIGAEPGQLGAVEGETEEGGSKLVDIQGKEIEFKDDRWGRPRPIISGIDVSEGNNGLSKKCELQITCFSLDQMIEIQKKFGEPAHSVFLEFGWNTEKGVKGIVDLSNVEEVVAMRNLADIQEARKRAEGHYDNFLGRITGGSLSVEGGEKFIVTSKLTGVGDLAAYLQGQKGFKDTEGKTTLGGKSFWWVGGTWNDQKRQFQYFFNDLPSYNRTEEAKALVENPYFTNEYNFINFDEELREDMGDETVDSKIRNPDGDKVNVPGNTPLIGSERFVKLDVFLSAVLAINPIPTIVDEKGTTVEGPIRYHRIPIRGHRHIFSTDKTKLLIPNNQMPDFGLWSILQGKEPPSPDANEPRDMSYFGISFPSEAKFDPNEAGVFTELDKLEAGDWGYLDDLYVNYDFAKGILESKTNKTYDVFIQILNGLSAACNNMWQFEIEKHYCDEYDLFGEKTGRRIEQLVVIDKALSCPSPGIPPLEMVLGGEQSVFLDASLQSDIPGAMMGIVTMGKASDGKIQVSPDGTITAPKTGRGLFTNEVDWIGAKINKDNRKGEEDNPDSEGSEEEKIASMYSVFQDKVGVYPNSIDSSADDLDARGTSDKLLIAIYDDPDLLRTWREKDGQQSTNAEHQVGQALLPIKFSFTIHGLSGWKRGDKFRILGLPEQYDNGFFQVTQINQQCEGMTWKTQVEGQFRNVST